MLIIFCLSWLKYWKINNKIWIALNILINFLKIHYIITSILNQKWLLYRSAAILMCKTIATNYYSREADVFPYLKKVRCPPCSISQLQKGYLQHSTCKTEQFFLIKQIWLNVKSGLKVFFTIRVKNLKSPYPGGGGMLLGAAEM